MAKTKELSLYGTGTKDDPFRLSKTFNKEASFVGYQNRRGKEGAYVDYASLLGLSAGDLEIFASMTAPGQACFVHGLRQKLADFYATANKKVKASMASLLAFAVEKIARATWAYDLDKVESKGSSLRYYNPLTGETTKEKPVFTEEQKKAMLSVLEKAGDTATVITERMGLLSRGEAFLSRVDWRAIYRKICRRILAQAWRVRLQCVLVLIFTDRQKERRG